MLKTEKAPIAAADSSAPKTPSQAKAPTKSATVLALLQREQGATLAELVDATGWQPHTTRAMLTGLRKKGHTIERGKRDDVTCYNLPVGNA
jgi:DNA-binding MarR family transcriptional regulator